MSHAATKPPRRGADQGSDRRGNGNADQEVNGRDHRDHSRPAHVLRGGTKFGLAYFQFPQWVRRDGSRHRAPPRPDPRRRNPGIRIRTHCQILTSVRCLPPNGGSLTIRRARSSHHRRDVGATGTFKCGDNGVGSPEPRSAAGGATRGRRRFAFTEQGAGCRLPSGSIAPDQVVRPGE